MLHHPPEFIERFARLAASQSGVIEEGGNNRGVMVSYYQSFSWLDGSGWAWCAAFVCWAYAAASITTFRLFLTRPTTPRAFEFEAWGKDHARVIRDPKEVRRGDIVIFSFSHVGIALQSLRPDGLFSCVEGNTNRSGSRDGDGVWIKDRGLSTVRSIVRLS